MASASSIYLNMRKPAEPLTPPPSTRTGLLSGVCTGEIALVICHPERSEGSPRRGCGRRRLAGRGIRHKKGLSLFMTFRRPGGAARVCGRGEWACKPGSVADGHLSRAAVACRLERATRMRGGPPHGIPICVCSGWGLPSRAVADALVRSYRTVSAFLAWSQRAQAGVFFSVALSVGSPRPAVSWHPALWSPDFPRTQCVRDRLAHSHTAL